MSSLDEMKQTIKADIDKNPIILYMKGSKLMPQCGFSAKVVHILNSYGIQYEARNVLEDDILRQAIKEYSDWPTIPQLYVGKEFIGGCDIVSELHEEGALQEMLEEATKMYSSDT